MKGFGLKPSLIDSLRGYSREMFMKDLMAGIIVGIVALPLAIAFGIASGVTPEKGIITAIIAGFLISLLGGSKVQIGGPTGAFIVIIYGIVNNPEYGLQGLLIAQDNIDEVIFISNEQALEEEKAKYAEYSDLYELDIIQGLAGTYVWVIKDTYGLTPGYYRMVESDDPDSELYYGYDLVAALEEWPGLPNGEILPD